jgi:hypothetical protein
MAHSLDSKPNLPFADIDFDQLNHDSTSLFTSEGSIHPYPAKSVPAVVRDILYRLKSNYDIDKVLDPFVGSGTVALETKLLGLDFYGLDLNPLAVLLARTKSLTIHNSNYICQQLKKFIDRLCIEECFAHPYEIVKFKAIDYWFKQDNILQLSYLKQHINLFLKSRTSIYKETFALIVLTAFSSTIRNSSLSRNGEFKLYRMTQTDISNFKIDSISDFKLRINQLLDMLKNVNNNFKNNLETDIKVGNAKDLSYLNEELISLIMTSPPYGDSKTTVSYGQFSRLPLQWISDLLDKYLGIPTIAENCDDHLLGGKYSIELNEINTYDHVINQSQTLKELYYAINAIVLEDLNRYRKVKDDLKVLSLNLKHAQLDPQNITPFLTNGLTSQIIFERVKLQITKKISSSSKLTKPQVKIAAAEQTKLFLFELLNSNQKKHYKRKNQLLNLIPRIRESINDKLLNLPRRSNEILDFFSDLYRVVEETDKVLKPGGIQVWIVGHRTVFGSLEIKLSNILLEWFNILGYSEITSLKRHCSFKRLPHHINSTITRDQKIPTMLDEYIIIVQKPNTFFNKPTT